MSATSSGRESSGGGGLSLGQWVALNDEIAALVRAGLPLDRGLMGASSGARGRLGLVAGSLARRLEGGASLAEALDAEGDRVPPVYRAVVEAGVRSGRLATALEGLADLARRQMELRSVLGLSMVYPWIVVCLAYGMLVGFLTFLVPRLSTAFASFRLPEPWGLRALEDLGRSSWYWWPLGPIVLIVAWFCWWRSGRASAFPIGRGGWFGRLPGISRVFQWSSWSGFADLLALLVAHDVPMGSALRLAGRASGDSRLARSADGLADQLEAGQVRLNDRLKGVPPLLVWLVGGAGGAAGGSLVGSLRRMAESYRRRAILQSEVARIVFPMVATFAVGGLTALVYVITLFLPISVLLDQLSLSFQ